MADHSHRAFLYGLLAVFFVLAGGIALAGVYYYRSQEMSLIQNEQRDLAAIAELKAKQIANWRAERLGDAEAIRGNALLIPRMAAALEPGAPPALRRQLLDWMRVLVRAYDYHDVSLLDADGRILLSTEALPPDAGLDELVLRARQQDQPSLSELRRDSGGKIYLDLAIPLPTADNLLMLLRMDPHRFLYPLIQSWPVPSQSAESILVMCDGEEVVVLNELRNRSNTALRLRAPISEQHAPAAMAARGVRGGVEGVDYRGVPVFASLQVVPGSPWLLVTKKDRSEALAPLHGDMATITVASALLILAAALGTLLLWRRQMVQYRLEEVLREEVSAQHLRESQSHLAEAQRIAKLGNWRWDVASGELWWSDEVFNIFGLEAAVLAPSYDVFLQMIHADDRPVVMEDVRLALAGDKPYSLEHRIVLPDGEVKFVHVEGEILRDHSGHALRIVGIIQDITRLKHSEEKIRHLYYYDQLTGLPNRVLLEDRLSLALAQAKRESLYVAVLFVDLDRFKTINDSLGHQVGDRILKEVAERLMHCVHEVDTVSRLSGDEFVVLCTGIHSAQDATHLAMKIRHLLSQRYVVDEQEFFITSSIGISLFPNDGDATENLMKNADAALHHAKERGRDNYQFFTAQMNHAALERLSLENSLSQAVGREEFELYYQPKINIVTGCISGMEALVRWRHPEQGMISPAKFIPLAEETGLIVALGEWVLWEACSQAMKWREAGLPPLPVAVNISPRQFRQRNLPRVLARILAETGLPAELLELEVTEGAVMERAVEAIEMLNEFKEMGVSLSIDDFGTGYSSLSYLKLFPIHKLKIDQSFVRDITTDPNDAAIVTAVLSMASGLKLGVIAEGVETAEQLEFLRQQGCEEVQGYHFSRPLPAADFARFVAEWPGVPG